MTDTGDALAPGTRLGDLEIEEVLGQGGFGVTYLAKDLSLDAKRAVKEYLPKEWGTRLSDWTVGPRTQADAGGYRWGLQRFLDEGRILARFDHRNLVRVYRAIEAGGTAYMVTEYVEGRTLKEEVVRSGPLAGERMREVLGALTDGLAVVHAKGLLHRDIKPENVMIRPDGTPVLIDFGSARQAVGSRSQTLTAVLSPGYAPVEQYSLRGDQGPWTDIYALGALAYSGLSGVVPAEAIDRLGKWDPLRPLAEVAPRVSPALARTVDRALRVQKEDRPQSLEEWRELLDREDDDDEDSDGSGTWPSPRAVGVAAVLALAVGLTAWWITSRPEPGSTPGGGGRQASVVEERTDPVDPNPGGTTVPGRPDLEDTSEVDPDPLVVEVDESVQAERDLRLDEAAQRQVQEGLAAEGFDPGPADGRLGPATREALRDWQVREGFPETGYLSGEQWARLEELVAAEERVAVEESVAAANVAAATAADESADAADASADAADESAAAAAAAAAVAEGSAATAVAAVAAAAGSAAAESAAAAAAAAADASAAAALDAADASAAAAEEAESAAAASRAAAATADASAAEAAAEEAAASAAAARDALLIASASAAEAAAAADAAAAAVASVTADLTVFRDCDVCPAMMAMPAGEFTMGSDPRQQESQIDERPQHGVRVGRFALGQYEVTRREYAAFVAETNHALDGGCGLMGLRENGDREWNNQDGRSWRDPGFRQGDGHPVTCVSWTDAQAYTDWLSNKTGQVYRLPSEAEWEYGVRAGTATHWYWGNDQDAQCGYGNGIDGSYAQAYVRLDAGAMRAWADCNDGMVRTAAGGSYAPNEFGLYDMAGNVWEWVADCWHDNYAGAPTDGRPWTEGRSCRRVLRGGAWSDLPRNLRSAVRTQYDTGGRRDNVGFRVARALD